MRTLVLLLLVLTLEMLSLGVAQPAWGGPFDNLFKRIETDPNKEYPLTEECGPWMIMAASFSGEGAASQAHALVMELRTKFKIEAYTYEKTFDFSGTVQANGLTPTGERRTGVYRRRGEFREVAVLVGNFPEVSDPTAQKLVKELKYAEIECMRPDTQRENHQSLGALRYIQRQIHAMQGNQQEARRGPLYHSFMTTNPLIPDDYFAPRGIDKEVADFNRQIPHNLLTCPGKYTVKVATFTGAVIVDQKKIQEMERNDQTTNQLEEAFAKAHKLTEELRKMGYEAYEFHDRYSSIVCVGSFDTLGQEVNGKINLHDDIIQIMKIFGAKRDLTDNSPAAAVGTPKLMLGIPFDVQPQIVEVPEESVSSTYGRLGLRR